MRREAGGGRWLERHWQRITPVSALLYPLSLVFRTLVALRRAAYRAGLIRAYRAGVPVIVIGNITAGGTGKTPLVLWMTGFLSRHGMQPGIVSRGYGSDNRIPRPVAPHADPARSADEPLLLAQRSGCPVWVGARRAGAAEALLRAHPDCNVIVSDDGLQHYRLARDVEIAVVDGGRGFGNGLMLPAGPMREPASRLRDVHAVVINGRIRSPAASKAAFGMTLQGREFRNVLNPDHAVEARHFHGQRLHAVAGIGHPARFFDHLEALGLEFQAHPFPDHHRFSANDLAFADADAILMTEKDAVKCAPFAAETHWALRVDAVPDPGLGELVLRRLRT